jgi:hypothetical protein
MLTNHDTPVRLVCKLLFGIASYLHVKKPAESIAAHTRTHRI